MTGDLATRKADARKAAFQRRKAAHAARPDDQTQLLRSVLGDHTGRPLAGFLPIRTEIDPRPAMAAASVFGPVGVPVIQGAGQALRFARWHPDGPLVPGPFGAAVPETLDYFDPEVLIVPLVAFSRRGERLGYGGGFYDRTLEALRSRGPVLAIGFAFEAQEDPDLPQEATDQPLDLIVTEQSILAM